MDHDSPPSPVLLLFNLPLEASDSKIIDFVGPFCESTGGEPVRIFSYQKPGSKGMQLHAFVEFGTSEEAERCKNWIMNENPPLLGRTSLRAFFSKKATLEGYPPEKNDDGGRAGGRVSDKGSRGNEPPSRVLYLDRLPENTKDEDLVEMFSSFEGATRRSFVFEKNGKMNGFFQFETVKDAEFVMSWMREEDNLLYLLGKPLELEDIKFSTRDRVELRRDPEGRGGRRDRVYPRNSRGRSRSRSRERRGW